MYAVSILNELHSDLDLLNEACGIDPYVLIKFKQTS